MSYVSPLGVAEVEALQVGLVAEIKLLQLTDQALIKAQAGQGGKALKEVSRLQDRQFSHLPWLQSLIGGTCTLKPEEPALAMTQDT